MEVLVALLVLGVLFCIVRINSLARRVDFLELRREELLGASARADEGAAAVPATPVARRKQPASVQLRSVSDVTAASARTPVSPELAQTGGSPADPMSAGETVVGIGRTVQSPPAEPAQPRTPLLAPLLQKLRGTDEWEALIGGRWLNRIGALALILGIGFFLKYAFDQNWITPWERVAIGVVIGTGLLVLARRSEGRGYGIFAQGLVGAGVSSFYLSVYAALDFYHLISQPATLAAMAAVTALAFTQALHYNSRAVALLAWAGGFLTPVLLSGQAHQPDEVGLFGYLALLVAGILAVLLKREAWRILEPLTLGAAYAVTFLWYGASYDAGRLLLTAFGVSVLWGLFYLYDLYRMTGAGVVSHRWQAVRHTMGATNGACYYAALYLLVAPRHRVWMGVLTLAIGAIYAATMVAAARKGSGGLLMAVRYSLTAIVLLIVATSILASGFTCVTLWSVEAALLLACGVLWRRWYVWQMALALYGLAVLRLLMTDGAFSYHPIERFTPVDNGRALAFAALVGALALGAALLGRSRERLARRVQPWLHYAWSVVLFGLLTVETNDVFQHRLVTATGADATGLQFHRFQILAAVWMLYALPLVWHGLRRRILPLLSVGLSASSLALVVGDVAGGPAPQPIERFQLLWNVRLGVGLLLLAGLLLQLRWLTREGEAYRWLRRVLAGMQAAAVLTGFALLTYQVNDQFQQWIGAASGQDVTSLAYGRFLALAVAWTLYTLPIAWFALRKRLRAVLLTDLAVLSLAVCLAAAAGAAYQPIERFHLLVNVRAGALLLVIAGLAVHIRWLMRQRAMPMALLASQLGVALLGFELVTSETNDYFRQLAGTAAAQQLGTGAGLFLELMVLATIWTVFSLLISWYGLRNTSGLILASGLGIGALGIGTGGIAGIVFQSSDALPLILSVRAAVLPFLIVALFLYMHLLRSGSRPAVWIDRVVTGIQTAVVLLGFELVTGETWDLFQNAIGSGVSASASGHLQNLEELALSVVWLAYTGILMCSGIWRRMRWLRLGAIALLGFVILKIFVYDLAFLQAAYRSVSFAGLGVVLLTVSYLYQRYRAIIWETGSEAGGSAAPAPEAG